MIAVNFTCDGVVVEKLLFKNEDASRNVPLMGTKVVFKDKEGEEDTYKVIEVKYIYSLKKRELVDVEVEMIIS